MKKTIRTINRNASTIDCQLNKDDESGCPDISEILNVDSFSLEKIQKFDPKFLESDTDEEDDPERESSSPTHHLEEESETSEEEEEEDEELKETRQPKRKRRVHHDNMGISSVGVTARGPLHQWRFNMFMKDFFSERAEDIFRSKGILCIKVMHFETNLIETCSRERRRSNSFFKASMTRSHMVRCRNLGKKTKNALIK